VDKQVNVGLAVVKGGQFVPELSHEGGGLLDENGHDHVGHLNNGGQIEDIAPTVNAALLLVPVPGNVVAQRVQQQLKVNKLDMALSW
jgi:hypothetical protein